MLEPAFEHERLPGGDTLTLVDKKGREVSLSSFRIQAPSGRPWKSDEMLATFPPPEFKGHHYKHRTAQVSSRALWMFGDSDHMPSCWLLASLVMSETTLGKGLQCTITTPDESDLGWALSTWRSIAYFPDQDDGVIKPDRAERQ